MHTPRHYYSLADAAKAAKRRPADLLHDAVQGKLTLLVGVPDSVIIRVYDETTNSDIEPFLVIPQFLALSQSQCLKIELNGRTVQSDFPAGYCIQVSGELRRVSPTYGYRNISNCWSFWRTFFNGAVHPIELMPDRLFVLHCDIEKIIEPAVETAAKEVSKPANHRGNNDVTTPVRASELQLATDAFDQQIGDVEAERDTRASKRKATADDRKSEEAPVASNQHANNTTILRLKQVMSKTGLSRSTIYDRMNKSSPRFDSTFPKSVSLGTGSVGWIESEINIWLETRTKR